MPDGGGSSGLDAEGGAEPPSGTVYLQVAAGLFFTCGLKTDNTAVCWGYDWDRTVSTTPSDEFSQISAGSFHACGVRKADSKVVCWGNDEHGQREAPADTTFLQVSAGNSFTCGLTTDSNVVCWGADSADPNYNPANLPTGTFVQISSGWSHACGLRGDGTATCWGTNNSGESKGMAAGAHFSWVILALSQKIRA